MNIKIIKASKGTYWYAEYIGRVFEVTRSCRFDGHYRVRFRENTTSFMVKKDDCRQTKCKVNLKTPTNKSSFQFPKFEEAIKRFAEYRKKKYRFARSVNKADMQEFYNIIVGN